MYKGTDQDQHVALPIFHRDEVKDGKFLGKGGFCKVFAVDKIRLCENEDLYFDQKQQQVRHRLARRFEKFQANAGSSISDLGQDSMKLAMKCLKEFMSEEDTRIAKTDIKQELKILLATEKEHPHPHIIQLYAVGVKEKYAKDISISEINPSFLVLNRIRTTLESRLRKWRDQRGIGLYEALSLDLMGSRNLWIERLVVLSKLSDAVNFLHSKHIIFRDLKPENVGFDWNDVPQIFDFGLAKKLDLSTGDADGDFKLTGDTGTPRYMAPEVALNQPYGLKADIYSLSILMHEVLSLKVPFCGILPSSFKHEVLFFGTRPPIDECWPPQLQHLFAAMWSGDSASRPKSEQVVTTLEEMLRGSDAELFPSHLATTTRFFGMF